MPRIKLLQAGYVRGDAKVGSPHIVSQEFGEELVTAGVAEWDETETLQAKELEGQRTELLALATQLTTLQSNLQLAQAEITAKDELIATLAEQAAQAQGLESTVQTLTTTVQEQDTQITQLQEALEVVKAAKASTALPDDFPERELFVAGGYDSLEKVVLATDEELDEVQNVGPATITKVRAYLTALAQG